MKALFNTLLYQPIFNVFVLLYNYLGHDLGVAIVVITIIMRLVLWPLTKSAIAAQKSMQALQPKLNELKEKFKDNKQAQTAAMMELYKEHKINPVGSCLPLLIQIPIFLALYWVLSDGIHSQNFSLLYSFVKNPGTLNQIAFGFLDLSKSNLIIAVLAGAAQYWQGSQLTNPKPLVGEGSKDESFATAMNTQMKYMMPIVTVFIGASLPSGLSLYWFLSTFLYALQQYLFLKKK